MKTSRAEVACRSDSYSGPTGQSFQALEPRAGKAYSEFKRKATRVAAAKSIIRGGLNLLGELGGRSNRQEIIFHGFRGASVPGRHAQGKCAPLREVALWANDFRARPELL